MKYTTESLFGIAGKVAIGTGGANGIGRAVARGLADLGARRVLRDLEKIESGRAETEEDGANAIAVKTEIADEESANVNAVAPTFADTELNRKILEDKDKHDCVVGRIPKGQLFKMEWLVGLVAFLAPEASRFMTGPIYFVDGGWSAA